MAKIPTTVFGRAAKLMGTGAKMLGREILSGVESRFGDNPEFKKAKVRVQQAQDLVDSLSHLKGAAMKAGQLLSLEMSDLLPPEVVEVLRQLHDNATFLPAADIKGILLKELGPEKFGRLQNLSDTPIAAASIGQVHRATLDGIEVALKIQYPMVAESIDTDLILLKKILNGALAVRGRNISFDAVFDELAKGLKVETDYRQEATALKKYRDLLTTYPKYVVPQVFEEFSTGRVLTLSYESGQRLNQWIKKPATAERKRLFAKQVLDLLMLEIFGFGVVQTDPNYGNFLVRDEGETLVLLDFGAVREYTPEFRMSLYELLASAVEGQREKFLALSVAQGFLDERESSAVKEQFYVMMGNIGAMFKKENQPFCFNDSRYLSSMREQALAFANNVRHTSPAHQIIFLNRKLGGMFHLLKDLDCRMDLSDYWQSVATHGPTAATRSDSLIRTTGFALRG